MDLISISRKYEIKKYILITMILLLIIAWIMLIYMKNQQETQKALIYETYKTQYELAKQQAEEIAKKKEEEKLAKFPKLTQEGITNIDNIYHSETKRVFLTFDDGPSKTITEPLLELLKQENVKATFFVLGSRVELYPEIVKKAYDEGHYIANHGYSHIYSQIYSSSQSVLDEYNKANIAIQNAIGEAEYNSHLFRFPGGFWGGKYANIKKEAKQLLNENEIVNIDWNCLTGDSAGNTTVEQFIEEIDKTAPKHTSVVVLMHDAANKTATLEAMPQIIAYFRDRGYEFKNFYDIIK